MAVVEAVDEAILEGVASLDYRADLPDPQQLIKVISPLEEILWRYYTSRTKPKVM